MAQTPTRVDSFADGGSHGDTEPGAPTSPAPGRTWADVFGTTTKPSSSPPMPPMPWEEAAAAPAPSWTAPLERFLASAAASLSAASAAAAAATQASPPPVKPRTLTVDASAPSHYTTLGVAPTASQAEIRAAYRRLALEHHPDRRGARGEERMARVNAAYASSTRRARGGRGDYDLRFGRFDGARRRTTEAAADDAVARPVRAVLWCKVQSNLLLSLRSPPAESAPKPRVPIQRHASLRRERYCADFGGPILLFAKNGCAACQGIRRPLWLARSSKHFRTCFIKSSGLYPAAARKRPHFSTLWH